jgi:hypothetical protein
MKPVNTSVGHLAWCGLIALHMARQDGQPGTPAQETLFLTRWLAVSEKQRCFSKELAPEIRWLLREGREKGIRADLPGKLEYLWLTGSDALLTQNDLSRLQHALQALQMAGWVYRLLDEGQWQGRKALRLNPSVSGLYLHKDSLHAGFNPAGLQTTPLPACITGDLSALDSLLQRLGWRREPAGSNPLLYYLMTQTVQHEDIIRRLTP